MSTGADVAALARKVLAWMPPAVSTALPFDAVCAHLEGEVRVLRSWGVAVTRFEDSVEQLVRRWPTQRSPVLALASLRCADLCLATAAAHGDAPAIAQVAALLQRELKPALSSLSGTVDFADEVFAQAQAILFSGPPPRIAEYAGHGPLGAWLKAIVIRQALKLRARDTARQSRESRSAVPDASAPHPERAYIRDRYRADFNDSFRGALARLDARGRAALRLHFVEGMTLEQVGAVYGVHRATAARWIATARVALFDETRRALGARLRVEGAELTSLLDDLNSALDVSLGHAFATGDTDVSD